MKNVQTRTILWHMVFWGFVINYIYFVNLNMTIVDMTTTKTEPIQKHQYNESSATEILKRSIDINGTTIKPELEPTSTAGKFEWNEYQQGLILGSFYWLHWLTQLPGGILAKKYGTKLVFGLSNVICCWMCFFIPMAAYCDYKVLIALRIVQGALAGLSWPAMHVLIAKWIPPNERSKFVTAYFGGSICVALAYPLFAYVIYYFSWECVYLICGIAGTIWWLGWLTLVYDSPAQHPRISPVELTYIEKALGSSVQQASRTLRTPWKAILTSRPVWMNVLGQWSGIWGMLTLLTQSPTYFKIIHNWDLRATGILSGIPHITRMFFAYGFSLYADYLLRTNKMERTTLRKFATFICAILMGLVVLALAYFGRDPIWAIVLMTLAITIQGSGSSGPLSSMIDIAPNFAGIVCGICGTVGCLPGFLSPYIVGVLTLDNQTFEAWTNVFLICAAMLIGCGVIYVLFSDSTVQKWNDYGQCDISKDVELLEKNGGFKESEICGDLK